LVKSPADPKDLKYFLQWVEENLLFDLRRMPVCGNPFSPHSHGDYVVEAQGKDRRSSACGLPKNSRSVMAPCKVFVPSLLPWIEKMNSRSSDWVKGVGLISFEIVAQPTSQAEI